MKALIFAAGLGTRLKPLTDTMPKAMVPIKGKPLLEHQIMKLKASGFDHLVINVHHFADQIVDFLRGNDNFGLKIDISDERDLLLETGGGVKHAAHFFADKEPFLIHNVDILSNVDLQKFYAENAQKTKVSLLVNERKTSRYLLFDEAKRLVGWTNMQTGEVKSPFPNLDVDKCEKYAFSGIQLFSPEIFPLMDSSFGAKFSIIDFYLSIADKVEIKAVVDKNLQLLDIGKLDTLQMAEEVISCL